MALNLETLNILNQYQDFIDNIHVVADMGCGNGNDALWWANLTTHNDEHRNIKVNAIDRHIDNSLIKTHPNIKYTQADFSNTGLVDDSHDFVWAYNSLQYSLNPIQTLSHWQDILKPEGMLLVTVPYNFYVDNHRNVKVDAEYQHSCYFNWTMGNLIMSLAVTGFDCRNSHFKIDKNNKYIQAAVYKLPGKLNVNLDWYEMCDKKMLPLCLEEAIMKNGNFKESDIICEWIDRTQYILRVL